jgi:hypothetical protein
MKMIDAGHDKIKPIQLYIIHICNQKGERRARFDHCNKGLSILGEIIFHPAFIAPAVGEKKETTQTCWQNPTISEWSAAVRHID